jgi:hypothetical protein
MTLVGHDHPPRRERTLRQMLAATFFAALLLVAGRARADQVAPEKAQGDSPVAESHQGAQGKRRTVLHFGDDDIHGDLTRPAGELVQAPRKPSQPSLLRVRKNFLDRALSGVHRGQ